jgi:hypothetical protein
MKLKELLRNVTHSPWKEGGRRQEGLNSLRLCGGGYVIGDVWYRTASNFAPSREIAEANAAYIIHATRSLPQLVQAVQGLNLKCLMRIPESTVPPCGECATCKARHALEFADDVALPSNAGADAPRT